MKSNEPPPDSEETPKVKDTLIIASLVALLSATLWLPARAEIGEQLFRLLPDDGERGDEFGYSVDVDDGRAIIGAYHEDSNGKDSGSAYLFDVTNGIQLTKLIPADGNADDGFGRSVGISGNTAIVGAIFNDHNGANSGAAYLFDMTTGVQVAKLTPTDGEAGDHFGASVGISGNRAIVGAYYDDDNGTNSGAAYLFDITTGEQVAKLASNDGTAGDLFGASVAISGNVAIVGAPYDDDNGFLSGSAYLFDATSGAQLAKLTADDGGELDHFGLRVDINSNMAIVGMPFDDDNGTDSGAAYLFDIVTGTQVAKLTSTDGEAYDSFGYAVGISGNKAIVGAHGDDDHGDRSGSAYLFDASTGGQIAKLVPIDEAAIGLFGTSVSIHGNIAIAGALYGGNNNGPNSGAVYLFSAVPEPQSSVLSAIAILLLGSPFSRRARRSC